MTAQADVPVVETERLRLRGWRDDDLDPYAELCADPEVMRYFGPDGATKNRAESAEQLAGFVQHWSDHDLGLWCAADRESDVCLGFIGLAIPFFLPEATEGATPVRDRAFGTLGLDRIVSIARVENERSWRVMEKLGMTRERVTIHPEYRFDVVVYELDAPGRTP
jgi:RimJ/RimL family protein N-acetyltransferase